MTTNDNELDRIRQRKMVEMIQQGSQAGDGKPVELTDETFEKEVAEHSVTVVDFWAAWCGPCRMVAPVIEELAREYAGRVTFGKLNVDENPAVSNAFQIQSIPSLLVFKNGKLVDGLVGAAPKHLIESRITPYLKA
jgi:thioredoxin 1